MLLMEGLLVVAFCPVLAVLAVRILEQP